MHTGFSGMQREHVSYCMKVAEGLGADVEGPHGVSESYAASDSLEDTAKVVAIPMLDLLVSQINNLLVLLSIT